MKLLLFFLTILSAAADDRGREHLARILAEPWAGDWKEASLSGVRLVEQKPDLAQPTGLPPVWYARIEAPGERSGYLMWDADKEGALLEFALDENIVINGSNGKAIKGVPPLQQFSFDEEGEATIASGCVPTSAASVVGFWNANGHAAWKADSLQTVTKRLRKRLKMFRFPDTDGFTENGMALAGAMPQDLAKALQDDADEHEIPVTVSFERFIFDALKKEIEVGRPALVSCTARVPHKPELSWGHEVAAVAWSRIGETNYVGILDNFFPTKHPETIRWIRQDAFLSLIKVVPKAGK